MSPVDITTVKRAVWDVVQGHTCFLRQRAEFHWRLSSLHRHGRTPQEFASKIQAALRGVTLIEASEHWQPSPKLSYSEVVFTVAELREQSA